VTGCDSWSWSQRLDTSSRIVLMLSFWGTLCTYSQAAALPDALLLEVSEGGESERTHLEREGLLAAAAAAEA
jgi:hypothetical protein